MHFTTRNVNTAFERLVMYFNAREFIKYMGHIKKKDSRNGPVLMIDEPVTITYTHPRERVLFNQARDANPFFHMFEALWMLAGRNDVAPLAYYAKQILEYSDNGKTLNGAYGYRWRHHRGLNKNTPVGTEWQSQETDQLDTLVAHLKAQPNSRRAVLAMWNVEDDLLKIGGTGNRIRCPKCGGLGGINTGPPEPDDGSEADVWVDCPECKRTSWVDEPASRDVACNLNVMFSIRREVHRAEDAIGDHPVLDMTVTNRSNDLVWGLLGANYVHFTILQEYMAARLGVEVGVYHHFTNNLHVYESNWHPKEWLECESGEAQLRYYPEYTHFPLVRDPAVFEEEVKRLVDYYGNPDKVAEYSRPPFIEPFLDMVASPLLHAFHVWRTYKNQQRAKLICSEIKGDDWSVAARNWFMRRLNKKGVASGQASNE